MNSHCQRAAISLALCLVAGPLVAQSVEADSVAQVDSLKGKSGKLLARVVSSTRGGAIRVLQRLFGDSAERRPGVYTASMAGSPFSFITLLPFRSARNGRLGAYALGKWPGERNGRSTLPEGFVEVTPQNQDTQLSAHFRLRDFLTHDQEHVWPKYLVVSELLIDKLELIIADLEARGIRARHVGVLSGFRTPQYNAQGVRRGGRARDSRHQYGDAADIFVDNDRDGAMDDLNGDGRVNLSDTRVLLQSVERVEREHPELAGGAGLYASTSDHGPFVHIDVRGTRVRWGI